MTNQHTMSKKILFSLTFLLLSGCASTGQKTESETAVTYIDQYPTRDRVEYVMQCIAKHGGLTFVTQYACGCKIDKIAEKMTFEEYEAATTFGYVRKIPGEKGGAFRDPKQSKSLKKRLQEAESYAERMCFVK